MASAKFRADRFSFRFTQLSPAAVARLRESLPHIHFKSKRSDVMVWEDLQENTDFGGLYLFLKEEPLDPATYSVWISVVTSSDHDGVAVPTYILDVIRNTQCGVDFSFVACLDEEDSASSEAQTLPG